MVELRFWSNFSNLIIFTRIKIAIAEKTIPTIKRSGFARFFMFYYVLRFETIAPEKYSTKAAMAINPKTIPAVE